MDFQARKPSSVEYGNRDSRSGIALVIVLWTLVLVALIAANFTRTSRQDIQLSRNFLENARAEALADTGVYRAVQELLRPQTEGLLSPQIENLLKLSSQPGSARRRVERDLKSQLGQLHNPDLKDMFVDAWRTDGTVNAWAFGGGRILVSIQDESGKIDLNAAPDELLNRLFLSVGLEGEASGALVDAIVDFRDEDDLRHLHGAEDRDYLAADMPHGAKDGPFEDVVELRQVMGMTRAVYERVAPALTVHSGQRGIDTRVAPREALLALQQVGFSQVGPPPAAPAEEEAAQLPEPLGAQDYQTTSSERVFTIRAEAHTETGGVFVRQAVIELIGARHELFPNSKELFRILAWKQGSRAAAYQPESLEQ